MSLQLEEEEEEEAELLSRNSGRKIAEQKKMVGEVKEGGGWVFGCYRFLPLPLVFVCTQSLTLFLTSLSLSLSPLC